MREVLDSGGPQSNDKRNVKIRSTVLLDESHQLL